MTVTTGSATYCANLYYYSAISTCTLITGATVYSTGTINAIGQVNAQSLTVDANSIIQTITCLPGFVAITSGGGSYSNSATVGVGQVTTIIGCLTCGANNNIAQCYLPAQPVGSTLTAGMVVQNIQSLYCASSYYLSAFYTCSSIANAVIY
jgi:hypothetical protein